MISTIGAMWAAVRLRNRSLPELLPPGEPRLRRRQGRRPAVTPVVAALRLFAGFAAPMRENAVIVAALRRRGVRAQLVVGAAPVPEPGGHYRVYNWIEIAGVPLDTSSPPGNYLVELARFPGIAAAR